MYAIRSYYGVDETLPVAPDRLEAARPRITDADVPRFAGARGYFITILIKNHGMDARDTRTRTARLHRLQTWDSA